MQLNKYSNVMKIAGKEKYFSIRKSIVLKALRNGIKPTAKKYNMSKNSIRLWMRCFKKERNDRLIDRRNGPNNIPHKTSKIFYENYKFLTEFTKKQKLIFKTFKIDIEKLNRY